MLKSSCRRFREELARGQDPGGHRRHCPACDAWAATLEIAAAAVVDRPLPAELRSRLRSIPRRITTCRDRDRLYDAARRGDADPATAEHLTACEPCRRLYETLESAFSEAPAPLPPALGAGLKRIARAGRRLPGWIAEPRLATAACVLIAVILSSMAADAGALWRDAGDAVSAKATAWAQESGSRGRRMWRSAATATAASYETSRQRLAGFSESCETFFRATVRIFGSVPEPPPKASDGGSSDGKPDPETD